MAKPKLKLDFCDFNCLDKNENQFTQILRKAYDIEISDRPDVLIFTEGGHLNRLYTCKKVFWTGESLLPDWSRTDYAMTCHYLDEPRHLRMPYYVWGTGAKPEDLIKANWDIPETMASKQQFCSFMVANGNRKRTGPRIDFFDKLHARKHVDSGGPVKNNIGRTIPRGGYHKHDFLKPYKFNICWENKSLPGYTTEKLIEAVWARSIPIYWGSPRVGEEFNKDSFLDRNDFDSDEALIEKILEIDADDAQWEAMLRAPFFHNDTPSQYYTDEYVLEFFERILSDTSPPISQRKRFFSLGRWKLVKRQHHYPPGDYPGSYRQPTV